MNVASAVSFVWDTKPNFPSVSYAEWLFEGLDYKEFNITCLMPSLTVKVYALSLSLSLSFVMTSKMGNCNGGPAAGKPIDPSPLDGLG